MRPHFLAACAAALLAAAGEAQTPAAAPDTPREPANCAQRLIDAFHKVAPRDPADLRSAEARARAAPQLLPVLRRIREHVALHPACALAPRVHEFTVWALAADDVALRETFVALVADGDADAAVLLRAAEVIRAADATARAAAVTACAAAIGALPKVAEPAAASPIARAALQCLHVAADLTAAEARQLAEHAPDAGSAKQLRDAAFKSENSARQSLDKPFTITGKLLDGSAFTSDSLRGKLVVVDFWATWCGPCVAALPKLVALRAKHGADKVAIVGISCDRDRDAMAAFLKQHPEIDWPQLFAGEPWHPLATLYGVDRIPRLFLIDRHGVLRSVDAAADLDALVRQHLDR